MICASITTRIHQISITTTAHDPDTSPSPSIYLARLSNQRVVCTPLSYDVTDKMFLSVVSCQDGDLVSGITNQAHVHKDSHSVFRFT